VSTTRRDLVRRLRLLLALTGLGTGLLLVSYWSLQAHTGAFRTTTAPAVLSVDTARDALTKADQDLRSGQSGGEDYQSQITVAVQNLADAEAGNVAGLTGRQTLQTAIGLVTVYTGWISQADRERATPLLNTAYVGYAEGVLDLPNTGIMVLLDKVQSEQRATMTRQVAFGWPLWLGWSAAALLVGALALALLEAQRLTRRRFRYRYSPALAAATLALALAAAPVWFAWDTHQAARQAESRLTPPLSGPSINRTGVEVTAILRNTRARGSVSGWIPTGGVLIMSLVVLGLQPRINEYGLRSR